jgi:hypothetical protein
MNLADIPEEALLVAQAVIKHLVYQKWRVKIMKSPWPEARYRPSLLAEKSGLRRLVETQGTLDYHKTLREYAAWLSANRHYAQLYLATNAEAPTQVGVLAALRRDGVGLWVIDEENKIVESLGARNPALVVTPDPTLKCGDCRSEVRSALEKFNEVNRKDGLRDMCELVERETEEVALIGSRKGFLKMNEEAIKDMEWAQQIDTLASVNSHNPGKNLIIEHTFKNDLHSFRGARNLVDHKVSNKREDKKRELQFQERMMQGPRLIAELQSLKRKIR